MKCICDILQTKRLLVMLFNPLHDGFGMRVKNVCTGREYTLEPTARPATDSEVVRAEPIKRGVYPPLFHEVAVLDTYRYCSIR